MKKIIYLILFALPVLSFAQGYQLEGLIKNSAGETLPGASVIVKGTSAYAVADLDGRFKIKTPEKLPFTLVVSFVGYKQQEIQISELPTSALEVVFNDNLLLSEVVITSRRRQENAQQVPIPISVLGAAQIEQTGSFNVNRLKELVPTVQLYSSNPRNTTLNIRGVGSTFGLTNDGIDPGVGFYVDGVYYARPAATTLDFIDIERIEVLRGPQGTLFGKNTTAGAFNITTRAPSFTPDVTFEVSYGNYGFTQAKASASGALIKDKLATRISFSGTHRDGLIYNIATEKNVNTLNNLGAQAKFLYTPTDKIKITLSGDFTRQRPDGYAQVFAGVVPTERAAYRQFENIIADLNYDLPSRNPFDRKIDHDTPWNSGNDFGGASLNLDVKLGPGTLTSTTAYRYWWWDPSNDRDFTGLQGLRLSQAPSVHNQWSQEIRYAGDFHKRLSGVIGVYGLSQDLKTNPYHTEEAGKDQWRFSQSSTSALWETPGLLDGYGIKTTSRLQSLGAAVFAQLDWNIFAGLHLLPGIRLNYDKKEVEYKRETYGGLDTDDPALIAIKKGVYSNQEFAADVEEFNPSGQVTLSYNLNNKINAFATYSASFKPVGINLGGLSTANGETMIELARIEPEFVNHYEVGAKTNPTQNIILNAVFHYTNIDNYQTLVQAPDLSVNRGYLANAEQVRVLGFELDASVKVKNFLSLFGSYAYTDGKYVKFINAPPPLEETGGETFKDISGTELPGISKHAFSAGAEFTTKDFKLLGSTVKFFVAADTYYRSSFSSSPSKSAYLNIDGYALLNARLGFRATEGFTIFAWGRNLLNKDYHEQLLPGAGGAGHYASVLGDPFTFGGTLRYTWKQKLKG
jgi:iron complex outermembrane recepter protein